MTYTWSESTALPSALSVGLISRDESFVWVATYTLEALSMTSSFVETSTVESFETMYTREVHESTTGYAGQMVCSMRAASWGSVVKPSNDSGASA